MPKSKQTNQKKTNKYGTRKRSLGQVIKLVLQLLTLFFLLAVIGVMYYFYHNYGKTILQLQSDAKHKVNASTSNTFRSAQTSLVYDAQGNLISTLKAEKDVYYLKFDEIPSEVIETMMESEDKKFFEHGGIDYLANIRAAIALIKHKGEITQGASTITQQLGRNVFLNFDVTYKRKIEEIFIAQELEKKYTKTQIMEFYLNEIYFANGHYGIQAAAQAYFGEGISSLSLSQMVFLCAIPNSPNRYNPLTNMKNTLERRDRLLLLLYNDGKISSTQYNTAINEKIKLKKNKADKKNYVETYVYYTATRALMKAEGFEFRYQFDSTEDKDDYNKSYDELYSSCQKELYIKGYRIYTSIDLEKQKLLQASVDDALKNFTEVNDEGVYKMQGAAVCIDNDSGKVVAIVGGRDQDLAGYTLNRAFQSFRQPGSAIKPLIVYTPSFERNYTPDSTVVDEYFKDGPKNADASYLGNMKLQRAIELSKNTVAWKLFQELTPQVGLSYLKNMNFAKISKRDNVPAAALGGFTTGVSPMEMASAYAAIESDGSYREPTCIVKITDADGNEIVGDQVNERQIYQTNAARIMTEALIGVIKNGTARGLGLTNTVSAGKTGTTDDKKDGWFVGYTPYYTTSVWVGYDMPKSVVDLKGATYPGTIWHNFMEQIHTSKMNQEFKLSDWRSALKESQDEKAIKDKEKSAVQKDTDNKDTAHNQDIQVGQDNEASKGTSQQQKTKDAKDNNNTKGSKKVQSPKKPQDSNNSEADNSVDTETGMTSGDGSLDTDNGTTGDNPDVQNSEDEAGSNTEAVIPDDNTTVNGTIGSTPGE